MKPFEFSLPVSIHFGEGMINDFSAILEEKYQDVLIVTDRAVAEKSGGMEAILPQLNDCRVTVFDQVEANPSLATLEKGREFAIHNDAQLIIGLGGGSPIDAAKGIAILAVNDGSMSDFMNGAAIPVDPLPVIAIPTTSGTGSEVTPYAVFTDEKGEAKGGISHPGIFPVTAIIDPALTYSMPENVIIDTGLDVLTHAIEAFLSLDSFSMSDMYALEAIGLVVRYLPEAVEHNHEAMARMAYASMLAGVAITNGGTILLHIMGYPLTVFHRIPHGRANAILLPAFMNFMKEKSRVQDKVETVNRMFNGVGSIKSFVENFGIQTALSAHGISGDQLSMFADKVIVKGDVKITPADLTKEIIEDIFRSTL